MEKVGRSFTPMEVVEIVGVTKRQLQHWDKTGLVSPRQRTAGGHARYSFQDLIALKTVKRLLDAGVSLQKIRGSVGRLCQILPTIRHVANDGQRAIAAHDCNSCHTILAQGSGEELMQLTPEGQPFRHPGDEVEGLCTDPQGNRIKCSVN